MIDLLTTPDEQEIADTVARMLSATYPVSRFRRPADQRRFADDDIVAALAALGCIGLGVPGAAGGMGFDCAVETLVFREYGRTLVSPAILGTVLAARIAAETDDAARLAELIAGKSRAGLAIASRTGADGRLDGELQLFDAAPGMFVHWNEAGAGLYDISNRKVETVAGLDETLTMGIVIVDGLEPLRWVDAAACPLPLLATLFAAAMMVGMGEAVRDMAVDHAKTRVQFGQPIGHFQAIKHKCADMALHAEAAWCETIYAALNLQQDGPGCAFHALNAKMLATRALLDAAKDNIQIHGGMGYTTEVSAHHFIKRGRVLGEIGGNIRDIERQLVRLPVDR